MSYDLWKTRDPNDTGFYDMPEDDGPTELDIAYQRIEALVKAMETAKQLVGAVNDTAPPAVKESNINAAWHILDDNIRAAVGSPP